MLKFGDKIIYIEGVLVEIRDDGSAAIDLKGRLGYLEIPQWMLLHEHPLVVGQEFGWNMSFPEQLGPVAAPVALPAPKPGRRQAGRAGMAGGNAGGRGADAAYHMSAALLLDSCFGGGDGCGGGYYGGGEEVDIAGPAHFRL